MFYAFPLTYHESLVKISGSPRSQQCAAAHSILLFPDTQRMLFILCRFLNKACNLITEVHLRVFSSSLRVRMPFATYVMMLAHLVMLSNKETGLLHTIYSW